MDERHLADDEDFDIRAANEGEFTISKPLQLKLPDTYIWECPKGHRMVGGQEHYLMMVSLVDSKPMTSRACPACVAIYLNENFPQMEKKEKNNAKE